MRLFIALDLSAEIRERLTAFIEEKKRAAQSVRFVRPEGLHVTLKFLGETSTAKLLSLQSALTKVDHPTLPLTVANIGFFPDTRRPRIYWTGITTPSDNSVASLSQKIDAACSEVGFPRETREFRPHITLARLNAGTQLAALLTKEEASHPPMFGMMMAKHFHLYESQLHPKGSIYTKLASFALRPNE